MPFCLFVCNASFKQLIFLLAMIIETDYHSNYHSFWCWIWLILVSEGPFERNISSVIRDKSIAVWKVFCQSLVTSILRNRNFWDSFRFPLVFLTTKACKAPINGTHISKGHLLKISLNHTLDSALLVEGFAKIVPVFNVPALFKDARKLPQFTRLMLKNCLNQASIWLNSSIF